MRSALSINQSSKARWRGLSALASIVAATLVIGASASTARATTAIDSQCDLLSGIVECTFHSESVEQVFAIPPQVRTLRVRAVGGSGGNATDSTLLGGRGAQVDATVDVTGLSTLYVEVGGTGKSTGNIAWNGGGGSIMVEGGGGGGASDVRTRSLYQPGTLNTRLVVAGGGGGAGDSRGGTGGAGGDAGMPGAPSLNRASTGGGAGTVSAGGAGGTPNQNVHAGTNGVFGGGGSGWGGGGGGGYYGGGGGGGQDDPVEIGGAGGGGGSSFGPIGTKFDWAPRGTPTSVIIDYATQSSGPIGQLASHKCATPFLDGSAWAVQLQPCAPFGDTLYKWQQFTATYAAGYTSYLNLQTGFCLGVFETAQGTAVTLTPCDKTWRVAWHPTLTKSGWFTLELPAAGRMLDTVNGQTTNNTPVVIGSPTGSESQQWSVPILP